MQFFGDHGPPKLLCFKVILLFMLDLYVKYFFIFVFALSYRTFERSSARTFLLIKNWQETQFEVKNSNHFACCVFQLSWIY